MAGYDVSSSDPSEGLLITIRHFTPFSCIQITLYLQKYDFPNGFFIGFEVYDDDERCKSYGGVASNTWEPVEASLVSLDRLRQKNISIIITADLSIESHTLPLFIPLFIVISVGAFTLTVYFCSRWAVRRLSLSE